VAKLFWPAKVDKIRIVTPSDRRDVVVRALHEVGQVEITSIDEKLVDELKLEREAPPELLHGCTSLSVRARHLLDVFETLALPPSTLQALKGWIGGLFRPRAIRKKRVKAEGGERVVKEAEKLLRTVEARTIKLENKMTSLDERISELNYQIWAVKLLGKFGFDLKALGSSEFTFTEAGILPTKNFTQLCRSLDGFMREGYVMLSRDLNEKEKIVVVCGPIEYREETLRILYSAGLESFRLPKLKGRGDEVLPKLKEKLKEAETEKKDCARELAVLAKKYKADLLLAREQLEIERARMNVVGNFSRTETAAIIQGWVPDDKVRRVTRGVISASQGMAHVKIESSSSKPPVVLHNPRVIRNFEMMTEMFGLPGKGEIDPTIFMAITFSFFFGFMLTDAVYGLILLIFSVALLRGIGRVNKGMRDFSIILIGGSLVAIATGIAMGSYLGDFIPEYLGISVPKLVGTIENPVVVLVFSILIGLAHIWIGLLAGLVQKLKLGSIKEAISDQLSWMILIPSGAILVCQSMGWVSLGGVALLFSEIFFGASVIILLLTRGPISIMNIFSMLGNILSYSRLMALALMTGAIALVVNLLAGMAWGLGILGMIPAALIFVGGHSLNLVLNALGGFIHSMRLHYVEFFGKFYTGEGPSFKPFKVERIYTVG